jgi:hypothetical protein
MVALTLHLRVRLKVLPDPPTPQGNLGSLVEDRRGTAKVRPLKIDHVVDRKSYKICVFGVGNHLLGERLMG